MTEIPIHFILNIERTGSSMLTAMLNNHEQILSTSEEPFVLYFYDHYRNKNNWTEKEIDILLDQFWLLAEKNISLYFSPKNIVKQNILPHLPNIDFISLCKLLYLDFLPSKNKDNVNVIIDKQIKYTYYPEKILKILPNAKYIILTRHYLDTIATWRKRNLANTNQIAYLAQIWQTAYSSLMPYIQQQHPQFILLRYEDLVQNPEQELRRVCAFIGKDFRPEMLGFHKSVNTFFEQAEINTNTNEYLFIDKLKDFHSSMRKPVNTENIGIWQQKLSPNEVAIANAICRNTALSFGYEIPTVPPPTIIEQIKAMFFRFNAWFSRRVYLYAYIQAPLWLKVKIKQWRPNQVRQ